MHAGYIWLIIALILFIAELATTGFVLACFGVGALLSAGATLLGANLFWQIIAFAGGSLASLFLLRPLVHRTVKAEPTNIDALVGHRALVTARITPTQKGRIKVDGDEWPARLQSGNKNIEAGETVIIVGNESIVMIVTELNETNEIE